MQKINLNDMIKVQLTDVGRNIYIAYLIQLKADLSSFIKTKSLLSQIDDQIKTALIAKWHTFQLYDFMRIFGPECEMGKPEVSVNNVIYMTEKGELNA